MTQSRLKVIAGSASADEVAAILAVLTAIASSHKSEPETPKLVWSNPANFHRKAMPTNWATSFLIR